MKPRRTAALALLTWYLMVPNPQRPGWLHGPVKIYQTQEECERLKGQPQFGCFPSDDKDFVPDRPPLEASAMLGPEPSAMPGPGVQIRTPTPRK